jgi:hypothetical protein
MLLMVVKLIHLRPGETCVMLGVTFFVILAWYLSNMKCLCMCSVTLCLSWMLLGDASLIAILRIHALASCILSRYARCRMWRMWCWSQTQRWCLVDPFRRWKDQASVRTGDAVKTVLANWTDLYRIPSKPRSIISLLISKINWVYILHVLMH